MTSNTSHKASWVVLVFVFDLKEDNCILYVLYVYKFNSGSRHCSASAKLEIQAEATAVVCRRLLEKAKVNQLRNVQRIRCQGGPAGKHARATCPLNALAE